MTTVRRPGRIQKIAYDDTPLTSRKPDIDARIGWLLAMSRLHHPDPDMADGRRFVLALTAASCSASRSLVSRWESGEIPISYEGMSGYERALGFEPGRISSLTGYMRAAMPGVKARVVRPQLDPAGKRFSLRLDELIELAEDGHARATHWQELGWHLAAVPLVHLRAHTWETLCHRVVSTLPRSVKVPYRQYSTAALNIASVPRAQEFLTAAVIGLMLATGRFLEEYAAGRAERELTRRCMAARGYDYPLTAGPAGGPDGAIPARPRPAFVARAWGSLIPLSLGVRNPPASGTGWPDFQETRGCPYQGRALIPFSARLQ